MKKTLGCLFLVVLVVGIVGYLTRDRWLRWLPGRGPASTTAAAAQTWQPLTPQGAARARNALNALQARNGPAYANVAPGDLAAYITEELARSLPQSADSIQAAAIGDRLYLRAVVKTTDLGDRRALGPLAMLLGERERLQLGGTLRIIQPGSGELQVKELKLGNVALPEALIPRLIRQISRGPRPTGLSPDGLPLRTPDYIGDVRVANGQITVYRTSP